jgi:hypothetical protein
MDKGRFFADSRSDLEGRFGSGKWIVEIFFEIFYHLCINPDVRGECPGRPMLVFAMCRLKEINLLFRTSLRIQSSPHRARRDPECPPPSPRPDFGNGTLGGRLL